ncbi:MAG TPA: methyltransferase domain-containing protein [Nitrososphaera sp.]|nr:methyltransferase domain-containing protein [Nitrososphaera sp.]
MTFDTTNYKITTMQNWDLVAPNYHNSWASIGVGPFKSTAELVDAADIKPADQVLDIACGTGAVSSAVMKKLGASGSLVGLDLSFGTLRIAKLSLPRGKIVQMDAENMGLHARFDKIFCQYALMFFPDSHGVLSTLRNLLKPKGRLIIAVHGSPKGVPYFSTIMEPVLKFIPNIRPPQMPTVHRFGEPRDLEKELSGAGYRGIQIRKFTFEYVAGSFDQYWADYLSTTANSIRKRIEEDDVVAGAIKAEARARALVFSQDGRITFPWDVLVAIANP